MANYNGIAFQQAKDSLLKMNEAAHNMERCKDGEVCVFEYQNALEFQRNLIESLGFVVRYMCGEYCI